METLRRIWQQARTLWAGFSGMVRVALVGGLVLTAALIALGFYLNRAEEVPLFGERLPADEVAAVQTALKAQNIPFTLRDQHTLMVPKEKHAAATVALAAEGVPARGGKGLELIGESNNILSTHSSQTALYQRALQGEMVKLIMQIDSVAGARVIVARPESHPFIRDQRPPTASVVLRMRPNAALNRTQASSIVSLVSRSVDGLKPENVTVIDSSGRLLSDPHAGDKEELPAGQMDYRRELEKHLEAKAVALLAARLGPGRAVVQVSADLNFQKVRTRETLYPKDGSVVKSERIDSNKSTAATARGPAGVESNIRPAAASGGGSNSAEDRTATDYQNSETVREMEERMGAVTRLTVAVTADLTPPPAVEGQPAPKALTAAEVQALVQNAVGFKTGRDSINVTDGVFVGLAVGPPPEPDEETNRIQRWASIVDLVRNISGGVAIALSVAVLLLFTFARRKKKDATAATGTPDSATGSTAAGTTPAAPQAPEDKRRQLLERFFQTARTDPDRTASVFGLLVGPAVG